jgi:hypothetical protein
MSKDEAQPRPTVTGREDLREELRGGGLVQHVGEVALDATVTTAVGVGVKVGYDKVKDVIAPKDKKK